MTSRSDNAYRKLGESGPELLLLHGWQHSIENLWGLGKCLAKHYQVYLLNLPGFHSESSEIVDLTTSDYVQFVKEFIEEHAIKPTIIGHSFGGRIAVKLSALYPEILSDRMVLIGTPGLKNKVNFKTRFRRGSLKYAAKTLKLFDKIFRTSLFQNHFVPAFGSKDYRRSKHLKNLFVQTINEDLEPFAIKIKLKTFLLWGANDFEAPLEQGQAYNNLILDSKLQVLPYHAHEPFSDVGAHYVAKLVQEFIDD